MNTILTVSRHTSSYATSMHTHKNFTLMLCTNGSGRIQFEDVAQDYTKGDLIIIEPNVLHLNAVPPEFNNIYLTIDNLPFTVDKILIAHDTATGVFAQCLNQINYFYNLEVSNKDVILYSFGELLTNLIVALSSMQRCSPVVERLKGSILKHFPESSLNINTLFEQEEKYNANYLRKRFKQEIGMSPQQFLINLRLTHAKKLLANNNNHGSISISQVAYNCGYEDPLYFSHAFKARYGFSPKAFYDDLQNSV
ncbi:MAG: helix-turn-helix domain-containing protein [Clostridiales bacterium]|nr:helix-turn-helix domain-containing protein [Clostridiales bacterium]